MGLSLFRVFLVINTFNIATESPVPPISYRFPVYPVNKCPRNENEFQTAAQRRNCSRGLRYLCAPNKNISSLIEFCTNVTRSLYGEGNCVLLQGLGNLNHYGCKEKFNRGCPSDPYYDEEIYRYPACLEIDEELRCFVADKDCNERQFPTTETHLNISNIQNVGNGTIRGASHGWLAIIYIAIALLLAGIILSWVIFRKRIKEHERKSEDTDENDSLLKDQIEEDGAQSDLAAVNVQQDDPQIDDDKLKHERKSEDTDENDKLLKDQIEEDGAQSDLAPVNIQQDGPQIDDDKLKHERKSEDTDENDSLLKNQIEEDGAQSDLAPVNVQQDDPQIDDDKLRAFLSKGEITVCHVRCIIVGCAKAGKTTLLKRLQNISYNELMQTERTEMVDFHVNSFEVLSEEETIQSVKKEDTLPTILFSMEKLEMQLQANADQLTEETDHLGEIRENASILFEKQSLENTTLGQIENIQVPRNPAENNNAENEETSIVESQFQDKIPVGNQLSSKINEKHGEDIETTNVDDTNDIEEYAISKIKDAVNELLSETDLRPRITVLDFAGQSMYYAFHQIFLRPRSCSILVVDMTKSLHDKVVVQDKNEKECSQFNSWRYRDYYKFWLKSIDSFSDTATPVIVVGTHADKLSAEERHKFVDDFFEFFDDWPHEDLRRHLNADRIYEIGFPKTGSELEDLKDIKKCIANIVNAPCYLEENIRPVWALFEQILIKMKETEKIISRKKLLDYSDQLKALGYRIDNDEISKMLVFLHRVGILLYINKDDLKEKIILDIQWLIDAFKCIIKYPVRAEVNDLKRKHFYRTGELDDEELHRIWDNEGKHHLKYKTTIMAYMQQLGLLTTFKSLRPDDSTVYYVPSMNSKTFDKTGENNSKSSILCFKFNEKKQLPMNVFHSIVSNCSKINNWSILKERAKDNICLYQNAACFSFQNHVVVLCICKFEIRVQVWASPEIYDANLLKEIKQSVENIIKEYEMFPHEIGYKCRKDVLNVEEDVSFISQNSFPVSNLLCETCDVDKKHAVDNGICWEMVENKGNQETHGMEIFKWKKDDEDFVELHNFPMIFEKVRNQPFVTFVGVPGSGKTATVRHISLILHGEGYEILPIKIIQDIDCYYDPRIPQVFVLDDVLGVFGLDMTLLEMFNRYEEKITKQKMQTKILMTCRELVYRHKAISNIFLTKNQNVLHLHSDENALSHEDKYALIRKYNLNEFFLSSNNLSQTSKMFPYLCNLFSKNEALKLYGPNFFLVPVPVLLEELDKMKTGNRIHYASLVLLMINQNTLSERDIYDQRRTDQNHFDKMKMDVFKRCNLNIKTNSSEIIDALNQMEGTFIHKRGSKFIPLNESMSEIIAYHFGSMFPELIMQYLSSGYIAKFIKVDTEKEKLYEREGPRIKKESVIDLCIRLSKPHYQILAERFLRDIEKGELYNVFTNKALKCIFLLNAFIDVLAKIPYTKLQSVFLTELKQESGEVNIFDRSNLQFAFPNEEMKEMHNKLMGAESGCITRAISWVIYFGHHKILQYILDQIRKHTGNTNQLFQTSFKKGHRRRSDARQGVSKKTIMFVERCRLLCLGCCSGDIYTVQLLLKDIDKDVINNKLSIGQENYLNIKPLVVACKFGYLHIVEELLRVGANPNIESRFSSPLTAACEMGHLSVVKMLIRASADVNLQNRLLTPLAAACNAGHFNVIKELVKAGACVNQSTGIQTPLNAACTMGNFNIVELLIKAGADINRRGLKQTPLSAACYAGHLRVVRLLKEAGADINLKDTFYTPLSAACRKGHLNVVLELIKAGADVNVSSGYITPLTAACIGGHLTVVEMLIKSGADVNLYDGVQTPLTAACKERHTDVVEMLINAGAN